MEERTKSTYLDIAGPGQPDPPPSTLDGLLGAGESVPSVSSDSSEAVADGVTSESSDEFDAAGCVDVPASAFDQLAELQNDCPSAVDELAALSVSFQALAAQAERSHDRAQAREQVIERMQERLAELQGDQVRALYGPVIQELAALLAEVSDAALHDFAETPPEKIAVEFSFIADRIEGTLTLLGLESVGAAEGIAFDARKHRAGRSLPTSDEERDRTIAAVRRQGYAFPGAPRTALYALVDVYRLHTEVPPVAVAQEPGDVKDAPGARDQVQPSDLK